MFEVRWKQAATDELAALWVQADSELRQMLTQASRLIDRRLARNPEEEGESRPNGRRILFCPPLGVLFRVDVPRSKVVVLHVWQF